MKPHFRVFPRRQSPGFLIYRTAAQMKAGLTRAFQAGGFNVTSEQWGVLSSLAECEGVHQSALAQRTAKDRHNITRILKRLEEAGFVRRELHPADRRLQRVFLTDEGKSLQAGLVPIVKDFLDHALNGLTQLDLDRMISILTRINSNLTGDGAGIGVSDACPQPKGNPEPERQTPSGG